MSLLSTSVYPIGIIPIFPTMVGNGDGGKDANDIDNAADDDDDNDDDIDDNDDDSDENR